MSNPATAREALLVEAIGDVAKLMHEVEALAPALNDMCAALRQANASLERELAGFEGRMAAITENAKTLTVRHIAARTDEAARRASDQQTRAMADAARIAFGAELGATMQRLQTMLRPLIERQRNRWDTWLTHAAAAGVASVATWVVAFCVGPR